MIFGYNTEIRLGDTVYHIQSETRDCERLLQTEVFVKGHCINKRSTPSEHGEDPQSVQECLRLQHRSVVECIRAGQLETVRTETPEPQLESARTETPDPQLESARTETPDPQLESARTETPEPQLESARTETPDPRLESARTETPDLNVSLRCTSAKREGAELVLDFQVTRAGVPIPDARLKCFLVEPDSPLPPKLISKPVADHAGMVGIRIDGTLPANAELQVELEGEERKIVRRFRLRQRESR